MHREWKASNPVTTLYSSGMLTLYRFIPTDVSKHHFPSESSRKCSRGFESKISLICTYCVHRLVELPNEGPGVPWHGFRVWGTKGMYWGIGTLGPKGLEPSYYSILFFSVLFCSVLLCSVLFCSVLFCAVILIHQNMVMRLNTLYTSVWLCNGCSSLAGGRAFSVPYM